MLSAYFVSKPINLGLGVVALSPNLITWFRSGGFVSKSASKSSISGQSEFTRDLKCDVIGRLDEKGWASNHLNQMRAIACKSSII